MCQIHKVNLSICFSAQHGCPLSADSFFAIAQFLPDADLFAFANSSNTIWKETIGIVEPFLQMGDLENGKVTLTLPVHVKLWRMTLTYALVCCQTLSIESLELTLKGPFVYEKDASAFDGLDDLFLRLFELFDHVM